MSKSKKVKPKEEVQYFTDEMHNNIFIFPEKLSSRAYGGKPMYNTVSLKRTSKSGKR